MKLLTGLVKFWQKPFPKSANWFGVSKNVLTISAVMTLFLYVFQPSGISEAPNKFLLCLGFGVAGSLAYFVYELVFKQLVQLSKTPIQWTYGKWLLYSVGMLLSVSLFNFIYVRYAFFGYMKWSMFPFMVRGVFMFGIPVLAVIVFVLLRDEQKYQAIAQTINAQKKAIEATGLETDLTLFNIPVNNIKYIEALQNYVTIGFVDSTGQLQKQTERATLKSILETTKESPILRTHRSFLVNRQAIVETSGNSQGLLLTLSDCDKKIPVARSYVANFKSA